MQKEVRNSNCS